MFQTIGLFILAVVAAICSAAPVPPFSETTEIASVALALLLYSTLLLPRFRSLHRLIIGALVGIILSRLVEEATWDIAPNILSGWFFPLSRTIGASGEGAYNADADQVFLLLAAVSITVTVSISIPTQTSE
ncbi:MAG TPA: hypothetical protein DDZ76_01130 [Xanthomonadales bacterium]|nr:hypothetical protein [Xanthomonadales bacterium]